MKLLHTRYCIAGLLAVLMVSPLWGQKTGSAGSSGSSQQPNQPSGSVSGATGQSGGANQPSNPQVQIPVYVSGRVLLDSGQPVPEPVSVGLSCGARTLQVIHSDLKGNFQFTLGAGVQSNMDMSASNDTFTPSSGNGVGLAGGLRGLGDPQDRLVGCELQVSVPGYVPVTRTISDPGDIGGIDAGTLELRRIAGVEGSAISVTSLLVPNNARKEFDKGDKDARGNHLASATLHFEKAVAEYDQYAAAWNELGTLYQANHEMEKAHQAFAKAITSDAKYIPPYLGLAGVELENEEYENAIETAGKALELDPSIGVASFIQAVGDLKLDRLDAAEKSALEAEKEPHQNIPQLHALLADIFLQKQDDPNAAMQMRAYLKESPRGQFADEMKKRLDQIEKSTASATSKSNTPSETLQIAP